MKMNINDVLCHKTIIQGATGSGALQCHQTNGAPNRSAQGCSEKNLIAQKYGPLGNPKLYSPASDIREATFYKCITDRQKLFICFKWNYSVKSMQTFLYACSVAVFKLFTRTFITFERKINFAWNFVFLCKNISSTIPEKAKQKYKLLAELLRFR